MRYIASMEKTTLEFAVGPRGWLHTSIRSKDPLGPVEWVSVRLGLDAEGTWRFQGTLFVRGARPGELPPIPLRRILLAVAASEVLRANLERRWDEPAPEPGTDEFLAPYLASGFNVTIPEPIAIERPAGKNLSDDFYKSVSDAYRAALANGLNPRTSIAESADVSNEVAGRWVRQARKRGYLPETEPGKVSI
jgi:hypothetical protein